MTDAGGGGGGGNGGDGEVSLLSRRLAELDESAAAFRPTRTIPR